MYEHSENLLAKRSLTTRWSGRRVADHSIVLWFKPTSFFVPQNELNQRWLLTLALTLPPQCWIVYIGRAHMGAIGKKMTSGRLFHSGIILRWLRMANTLIILWPHEWGHSSTARFPANQTDYLKFHPVGKSRAPIPSLAGYDVGRYTCAHLYIAFTTSVTKKHVRK